MSDSSDEAKPLQDVGFYATPCSMEKHGVKSRLERDAASAGKIPKKNPSWGDWEGIEKCGSFKRAFLRKKKMSFKTVLCWGHR